MENSGTHKERPEQPQSAGVPAESIAPLTPPGQPQGEITNPDPGNGFEVPPTASPHMPTAERRKIRETRENMPLLQAVPEPEEILFQQALEHAFSADAKAYIVEKAPGFDQTTLDIYQAAERWSRSADRNRIRVYTAVSMGRTALGNEAWSKAVYTATRHGGVDFTAAGERIHALEPVIAPQVDRGRLEQVRIIGEETKNPRMKARILGATAARLAAIGETDEAINVIDNIPTDITEADAIQKATDRARVAVVGRLAQRDRFATGSATVAALASIERVEMQTWAKLKIAGHMDGSDPTSIRWEEVDAELPVRWVDFSLSDRLQIIDDLVNSGNTDRAEEYAMRLDNLQLSTAITRQAQADKVIDVAKAQMIDRDTAAATLMRFRKHTEKRLGEIGGYRGDGLTPDQRTAQTEERYGFLGQITAAELVIKTTWNPSGAMPQLHPSQFHGNKSIEYHDKACAEVAAAIARNGDTSKALALIERIGWHPLTSGIKSKAFADIGRAAYNYRLEHRESNY